MNNSKWDVFLVMPVSYYMSNIIQYYGLVVVYDSISKTKLVPSRSILVHII